MDAQALISTAEGGLQETEALLQRIRELAVQASNDTNSDADRTNLNNEAQQLLAGINAIASRTTWAGQNLLDGSSENLNFHVGGGSMNFDQITSSIQGDDSNSLGLNGYFISVEKIASTSITSVFNSGLDTPYPGENNSGDFFVNKFTDENFVKIKYSYNLSESKIDIGGKTYQLQASAPKI